MIYSSCNIYQRTFRKGLFITQYICNEHSERRRGRFVAPASSTKTIDCNLQNITDCNANNGKTQHHFREFRGHGHDKSAPTPTGWTWKNTFPLKKHYQIENERYTQRTFHKGLFITQYIRSKHSTRGFRCAKCIAACIPKGVGADSSRPHHQQKQLVVICKILRITMPTVETKYEKNNIA